MCDLSLVCRDSEEGEIPIPRRHPFLAPPVNVSRRIGGVAYTRVQGARVLQGPRWLFPRESKTSTS